MKNPNTDTVADNEPFDTISSMDSRLAVILHSLVYAKEEIGEDVLYAFATLVDEVQRDLKCIEDYCVSADYIASPLRRNLAETHPNASDLLDSLCLIDSDGKIQKRFIQELYQAKSKCKHPLASM